MTEERDYVAEATKQGWNPDFEGDNKVDAQTFVEKGEKIAAIAQSQRDRDRVHYENRIQTLEQSNKEFGAYKDGQLAKERTRNAELLSQLEARKVTAINDSDGAEAVRVDREIEQVRSDLRAPEPRPNSGQMDVLAQAWLLNNDWYNTSHKLKIHADAVSDEIVNAGFVGGSPAYYAELTRVIQEDFPEEFENKRRSGASSVEKGGTIESKTDSSAHTYENLPPEAKKACDRFVVSGHTTKESYCESYDWE